MREHRSVSEHSIRSVNESIVVYASMEVCGGHGSVREHRSVWLHGSRHNYGSVTVRMETQEPGTKKIVQYVT